MEPDTKEERTLAMLKEREGCSVVSHVKYKEHTAYVFTQDHEVHGRSYGYCIPRENGETWGYHPRNQTFLISEEEIIKNVGKDATRLLRQEWEEMHQEGIKSEMNKGDNDEDSTE